jgi:phosphate-selective porin
VNATAATYLEVPRGRVVITALDAPLNVSIDTTLRNVDGASAFTGTATVAHGAELTIAVNGHPPVTVTDGHFSIPLS